MLVGELKRTPLRRKTPMSRGRGPNQSKGRINQKSAKQRRTERLDSEWSTKVRERDQHVCRRCGGQAVHAHHVVLKNYSALRHNVDNGVSVCAPCHTIIHAHGGAPWIVKSWDGQEWIDAGGHTLLEASQSATTHPTQSQPVTPHTYGLHA